MERQYSKGNEIMCGSIRCGSARKLLILLFIAFVSACSDGNGGSSSDEAAAANDQSHQAIITDAGAMLLRQSEHAASIR